jgi:hypothetical protein
LKERVALEIGPKANVYPMLAAVNLDNQAIAERCKVDDVGADWRLPAKVEAERFQFA